MNSEARRKKRKRRRWIKTFADLSMRDGSGFRNFTRMGKKKVKLSRYTPWRHMGGEEV
jgi:hypothetical protein